jgi:hypothetical protein
MAEHPETVNCVICDTDDGLALLCGQHWSEYTRWAAEQDGTELEAEVLAETTVKPGEQYVARITTSLAEDDDT